jgi:hypothetical protein
LLTWERRFFEYVAEVFETQMNGDREIHLSSRNQILEKKNRGQTMLHFPHGGGQDGTMSDPIFEKMSNKTLIHWEPPDIE